MTTKPGECAFPERESPCGDCTLCKLRAAVEERDRLIKILNTQNTLTCVYCGHAYPPGTPTHGSQVLTEHIKVCPKHPLRAAHDLIRRLVPFVKTANEHFRESGEAEPDELAGADEAIKDAEIFLEVPK